MRKLTGSTTTAAVLEALVIFIGILGALFADSWWEQRETLSREVGYLEDLAADFAENRARLNEQIMVSDSIVEAALILLAFESPASARLVGTDSLNSLLQAIHHLPTFEPVNKTYDNILGAGDLLTLRDRELRAALANFQARLVLMNVVQETQERQYVSALPAVPDRAPRLPRDCHAKLRRVTPGCQGLGEHLRCGGKSRVPELDLCSPRLGR